jgi:hypothetical protein
MWPTRFIERYEHAYMGVAVAVAGCCSCYQGMRVDLLHWVSR